MRARIDDGMEASAALLDVQAHALAVSRAAVEAEVLEGILEVEAEDSGLGEMLERLAVLYALSRVEADMAGYLTTGLVTSNGASQIRDLVTDLCAEVAAESLHLVDSFGIPDQVLSAPIAVAHTMA
jgi:acyl-CoA oxidase